MRKLFALGISAVLAFALSGCVSVEDAAEPNSTGGQTSTAEQSEETTSANEGPFRVGEKVTGNDFSFVVNSVRTDLGADFVTPENDFFLVLNVTFENLDSESVSLSSFLQAELQGSDSYVYSQALFAETKGSLDGDVAAGGSLRGELAFDVPELDGYTFSFKPNLFNDAIQFVISTSDINAEGSASEQEASESSAQFGVGDTIDGDGYRITLNSAEKITSDSFGGSPDNDFFLLLDVTIENLGDEEVNVSSVLSLTLRGSDSYDYDQSIFVDTKGSLDASVRAGGTLRGQVAYDVPSLNFYEFSYSHNAFTGGSVTFVVNDADL
jgi:hypothetical protein